MIKRLFQKLEAAMTAAAFAEEGDADAARRIMDEAGMKDPPDPRSVLAGSPSTFRARATAASGSWDGGRARHGA